MSLFDQVKWAPPNPFTWVQEQTQFPKFCMSIFLKRKRSTNSRHLTVWSLCIVWVWVQVLGTVYGCKREENLTVRRTGRYKECLRNLHVSYYNSFLSMAQQHLAGQGLPIFEASRSHSHTTLGRTPMDEWSARRRNLYLITHNAHKRQRSLPPTGNEPPIPANKRSQTHAIDRAATGIGHSLPLRW